MVRSDPTTLRSSVLVVPHHGSKTSSSAEFLDATAPSVAVLQAGYRNRFGHPEPTVMARYVERGIEVRRSAACGAWLWSSAGAAAAAHCTRDDAARYWHHRPIPE